MTNVNVIFHDKDGYVANKELPQVPESGCALLLKGNIYQTVGASWHIDDEPYETDDEIIYPPFVIVSMR